MKFEGVFNKQYLGLGPGASGNPGQGGAVAEEAMLGLDDFEMDFLDSINTVPVQLLSELERYYVDPNVLPTTDILQWWWDNWG